MSIRLQVKWPNAKSPLLQNPTVTVLADDADLPAISQAPGLHQFDIPDGTLSVRVAVQFQPALPVGQGRTSEEVVLSADQAYVVLGTTLIADPLPFRMVNGQIIGQNVHPLIDTISTGNAPSGLTIVEVRTEFVDVTAMWRVRANQDALDVFDAETERDISLTAIGATGSTPTMWFASFPLGLTPPSAEVGTLVFFRPSVTKSYKQPFEVDGFETQHALNRYLLSPRDSRSPVIVRGEAKPRSADSFFFVAGPTSPIFLRASFHRALAQSGKPIVLLQPWPQGGTNFGDAATARLPKLLKGILRFLRGMGFIAPNLPNVTPGRLGLAGYSAGGPATFAALRANAALVRELYLFDPMFMVTAADAVIQWATRTPDFRLRMTGEVAFGSMHAVRGVVQRRVSGEAGDAFVTALPETKARYRTVEEGGWPWWNFAIGFIPEARFDFHNHHQFVLYGGAEFETAADSTVTSFTPFMEQFLKASAF
jgi:hypothetical protein